MYKITKDKEKAVLKRYDNVSKALPETSRNGINVIIDPELDNWAGLLLINVPKYFSAGELVIEPKLLIGKYFFELNDEEQELIIAHELGHYTRFLKNPNANKLKRQFKWLYEKKFYDKKSRLSEAVGNLTGKNRHKDKRLKEFKFLYEISADKQVIKIGRGQPLIKLYRKFIRNYGFLEDYKAELQTKIASLEKILGVRE